MDRVSSPRLDAHGHDEYRTLKDQHQDCEARLSELERKGFLRPDEQVERTKLKKRKLLLRDRMEEIRRSGAAPS